MKRTVLLIITCVITMSVLAGCSAKNIENIPPTEHTRAEETEDGTEANIENSAEVISQQSGNYAFDQLETEAERKLYAEIYTILINQDENVVVSSILVDTIDYVFQCVMNDHPEIFYANGYTYTKYSVGDETKHIAFSGTYTMDRNTIQEMQTRIDAYVAQCINEMDASFDSYEKVKYIYEYLIYHTTYDLQAKENQNICSVCVYGASVCQGYAKTMQYILNQLGIPTTLVIGTVDTGEGHAWNLVTIDGAYYYVDATWGDAFYQLEGEGEGEAEQAGNEKPQINYDYLCVTTEQLCTTHVIDNIVPMPECTSMKDNYYVREGAYLEQYESSQIQALFEEAYASGKVYVTLKCATPAVFQEMKTDLIENQKVFQFLQDSTSQIAYINNKDQLTLSFWLS